MASDFSIIGSKDLLTRIKNELSEQRISDIEQTNDEYLSLNAISPQDIKDIFELILYGLESAVLIIDIVMKIKKLISNKESIEIKTEVQTSISIDKNSTENEIKKFVEETIRRMEN